MLQYNFEWKFLFLPSYTPKRCIFQQVIPKPAIFKSFLKIESEFQDHPRNPLSWTPSLLNNGPFSKRKIEWKAQKPKFFAGRPQKPENRQHCIKLYSINNCWSLQGRIDFKFLIHSFKTLMCNFCKSWGHIYLRSIFSAVYADWNRYISKKYLLYVSYWPRKCIQFGWQDIFE